MWNDTVRKSLYAGLMAACLFGAGTAHAQTGESTARTQIDRVREVARAVDPEARLVAVTSSDISPDFGVSDSWLYLFLTTDTKTPILVIRQGDQVVAAPAGLTGGRFLLSMLPTAFNPIALPTSFIDSDVAIAAAERNGGLDFRTTGSQTVVSAYLVRLPEAVGFEGLDASPSFWVVTYASRATGAYRVYLVDAQSGNAVDLEPRTAKSGLARAQQESVELAADAALVQVRTVLPDLNTGGQSLLWGYTFYSQNLNRYQEYYVVDGLLVYAAPPDMMPSKRALPTGFIDSDKLVMQASDAEAMYRDDSLGSFVSAELARGLFPGDSLRPVWKLKYAALSGQETMTVYIDAASGMQVRVGVDAEEDALPERFELFSNYPNPFNPETVIAYQLPQAGQVRLSIYDALGRKVTDLFEGRQEAGKHTLRWNGANAQGSNVASGTYLYRLEFGGQAQTRTMVLLR